MITIFNRPSIITLDCFTYRTDVHNLHPISKGAKYIPQWWKDLPAFYESNLAPLTTMKKCRGFTDLYDNSIVVPMWTDLVISYDQNGIQYQFADGISELATHNDSQKTGFLEGHGNFKLTSPWLFKTKKEINFMTFKPVYNYPAGMDFEVLPGILNFKYQSVVNMNIALPKVASVKKFMIEANTPIWQLAPMTEKRVEIKNHVISRDEFLNLKNETGTVKFVGSYGYSKKIIQQKESKCPFGFGK